MYGEEFNPNLYELIPQTADHVHWDTGESWNEVNDGMSDTTLRAGGGHAHSGLMIYLGDNWPERYRNSSFTLNFHGRRINNDILVRRGSGYVGKHADDLFLVRDEWFRGIDLIYGPDGSVFVADWSDTGECHEHDGVHRSSGRIYRISYGEPRELVAFDLSELDDEQLAAMQLEKNDWYVRQCRRLLQERAAAGIDLSAARDALERQFANESDERRKLRAMWALEVIGALDEAWLVQQLAHPGEYVRAWAIRLLMNRQRINREAVDRMTTMATNESSSMVRLYLAAALQQLPFAERWDIAAGLAARLEDADDRQLPLMIWYGLEAAVPHNPDRAIAMCRDPVIPLVRRHIARRITSEIESTPASVDRLIRLASEQSEPSRQLDILQGMADALEGRRKIMPPSSWPLAAEVFASSPSADVRGAARELGLIFRDKRAIAELEAIVADPLADASSRCSALRLLVDEQAPGTLALIRRVLDDDDLTNECIRGFAAFDDPSIPDLILRRFHSLDRAGKSLAIDTLSSRVAYGRALLESLASGFIPRDAISASQARQLYDLQDKEIISSLERLWGVVRPTAADKQQQIQDLRDLLTEDRVEDADPARGRDIFDKACSSCHKLYGEGRSVGPDLTGSDRHNLTYLLENIIDPSASVGKDFRATLILTEDGRAISGVIVARTDRTIKLRTQTEEIIVSVDEIAELIDQDVSLMPDGILNQLSKREICDLIAYLMTRSQTPRAAKEHTD
jgi:putative heme-binding domain-containing protein